MVGLDEAAAELFHLGHGLGGFASRKEMSRGLVACFLQGSQGGVEIKGADVVV